MTEIEIRGMKELLKGLDELCKKSPEIKRELHTAAAERLKETVDREIIASGVNDSHGKIRGWQAKFVGSGGGYAAVRPQSDGYGDMIGQLKKARAQTGPNSPGAITNYLENGHRIRTPFADYSGKRVKGYHFYQRASESADREMKEVAEEYADKLADRITDMLGGD